MFFTLSKFFCRGRCYTPMPVLHTSTVPYILTHSFHFVSDVCVAAFKIIDKSSVGVFTSSKLKLFTILCSVADP
jgi:hypothetical protein